MTFRSIEAPMRRRWSYALLASLASCQSQAPLGDPPYEFLSDYRFFSGPMAEQEPADGVVPYRVVAPLFSDHADKGRFVVLPAGETIEFDEGEEWDFPLGTIIIKTFFFDVDRSRDDDDPRLIETRLLIHDEADDWSAHTYVWNDEQTEAVRTVAGSEVVVEGIDNEGRSYEQDYIVPDTNACSSCHARDDRDHLLGLITHQVNFTRSIGGDTVNQLEWLDEQGLFREALPRTEDLPHFVAPSGDASLDARARSYLHANCSHCHRPGAGAGASHLSFLQWEDDPARLGVCKISLAAGSGTGGRKYDIVPGSPDESIVTVRMASDDPDIKMPEIPNLLPDEAGLALVEEWIAAMEPIDCAATDATR